MDLAARLNQNLEILGLSTFRDISLKDLEVRIYEKFPSMISQKLVLHTYLGWLNERLKAIDGSDDNIFTLEIAAWCNSLRVRGFDKTFSMEGFQEWKKELARIEPLSVRRFNLVEVEIQRMYPLGPFDTNGPESEPNILENSRRLATQLSVKYLDSVHADSTPVIGHGAWNTPVPDVEPDDFQGKNGHRKENLKLTCENNEPISTGLLKEPSQASKENIRQAKKAIDAKPRKPALTKQSPQTNAPLRQNQVAKVGGKPYKTNQKPPRGYICNRCGVKGEKI
jgi:hypothetical protein